MIRLPLTSISLSHHDVDAHLKNIDVYHGLLKNGFKKKEILKVFYQQKARAAESRRETKVEGVSLSVPTTVELALQSCSRADLISTNPQITAALQPYEVAHTDTNTENTTPRVAAVSTSARSDLRLPKEQKAEPGQEESSRDGFAFCRRHAPRQSSMLRFAASLDAEHSPVVSNTSSSSSSGSDVTTIFHNKRIEGHDEDDIATVDPPTLPLHGMLDSLTLEHTLTPRSRDGSQTVHASSSLRAEATEFTPRHQRSRLFGNFMTEAYDGAHLASPSSSRVQERAFFDGNGDDRLQSLSATRIASERPQPVIYTSPSSPPSPAGSIPLAFVTPKRVVRRDTSTGPEPYRRRHVPRGPVLPTPGDAQPQRGTLFSVYDDSLPVQNQPQTPADLTRGLYVDGRSAAYTAPPGMVRPGRSARRSEETESSEMSPAASAVHSRGRRQREYVRSVRVEEMRIRRRHRRRSASAEARLAYNTWMEDLDADRVGEENFEETAGRRRRGT